MRGCKHLAAAAHVLSVLALFCATPAHSQFSEPALCPPVVSPGVVEYPRGIIPFDDGLNRGDFVVGHLEYSRFGGLSSNAVYTPYPKPPVDIVDPYKSWTLAAIYAQCYYYYPPGLIRILVVEEYSKRGRVTITDPHCGPGGMASGSAAPVYDAYEPIPTDPGAGYTADCGDPGGGGIGDGGGGDDICVYQNLDPGCYDVYVDGAYTGTVCC